MINKRLSQQASIQDRNRRHGSHYSMPELGNVAIEIYATVVSNHYNRRNLRSEGSIRQVLQENRVFN